MSADTSILMGRIGAPHGVRGEVRITAYTENPEDIAAYGPLSTDRAGLGVEIEALRVQKSVVIARIRGVADRDAAERLNGVGLYCDRAALPEPEDEDEFYHADLIGLEARLADGTAFGTVTALADYGAGDLIEIREAATGASRLYPFTRAVVPTIAVAEGHLVLVPPVEAADEEEAGP